MFSFDFLDFKKKRSNELFQKYPSPSSLRNSRSVFLHRAGKSAKSASSPPAAVEHFTSWPVGPIIVMCNSSTLDALLLWCSFFEKSRGSVRERRWKQKPLSSPSLPLPLTSAAPLHVHSGNFCRESEKFPRHGKVPTAPLYGRFVFSADSAKRFPQHRFPGHGGD